MISCGTATEGRGILLPHRRFRPVPALVARQCRCVAAVVVAMMACLFTHAALAQIRADLPDISLVPPGQPSAIDGVYTLTFNGAQYRIEAGRIAVVTPYTFMVIFKAEPGMVVTKDVSRAAPGEFVGYDLALKGKWTAKLHPDGTISVNVAGQLVPFSSTLIPVKLVDSAWQQREIAEMQGKTPPPVQYGSRSGPDNSGSIYPPGWDAR